MNYTDLQQNIRDWLMRPDLEPHIPTFIRLAESSFDRVIRAKEMMERARAVATEQYVPLPPDWLEAKNVQRAGDGYALDYLTLEELDRYRWKISNQEIPAPSGPTYYSYMGDTIELAPAPTAEHPVTMEIAFYRAIPKLSDEQPENWLSRKWPDIYIYGALLHSAPFLKADERIAVWQGFRDNAIMELNAAEQNARRSGSSLTREIRNDIG